MHATFALSADRLAQVSDGGRPISDRERTTEPLCRSGQLAAVSPLAEDHHGRSSSKPAGSIAAPEPSSTSRRNGRGQVLQLSSSSARLVAGATLRLDLIDLVLPLADAEADVTLDHQPPFRAVLIGAPPTEPSVLFTDRHHDPTGRPVPASVWVITDITIDVDQAVHFRIA